MNECYLRIQNNYILSSFDKLFFKKIKKLMMTTKEVLMKY